MKWMCLNRKHSPWVAYRRGLCVVCYNDMKKLVDDGKTTWEAMEAEGKCMPPRVPSPKDRDAGGAK